MKIFSNLMFGPLETLRHLSYESNDQYRLSQPYIVLHKYHIFRMETSENLYLSPSGATPIIYIFIFALITTHKKKFVIVGG
jgi:hypothetical protein